MSWFSRVLRGVKETSRQQGEDFLFEKLGQINDVAEPSRPIVLDEEYVTIRVKASRISDVRRWTTKFHAAVHARAHYLHQDLGSVEVPTVLVPALMKDLDPGNLDRVISVDRPVLGPVPYVGGLALELGLFSVKGEDLASPYIDLLTSMADASGVGFLRQAVPFVAPLQQGLDLLFGNKARAECEIGLDKNWGQAETGTWLLMRVPQGTVAVDQLRLHPQSFHLMNASKTPWRYKRKGEEVLPPYVVLSIEASQRRDDWMKIPELKQGWDALSKAANAGDADKLPGLLQRFSVACRWSPDLVPADARRLRAKAETKLEDATPRLGRGGELGDLESLDLYGP